MTNPTKSQAAFLGSASTSRARFLTFYSTQLPFQPDPKALSTFFSSVFSRSRVYSDFCLFFFCVVSIARVLSRLVSRSFSRAIFDSCHLLFCCFCGDPYLQVLDFLAKAFFPVQTLIWFCFLRKELVWCKRYINIWNRGRRLLRVYSNGNFGYLSFLFDHKLLFY